MRQYRFPLEKWCKGKTFFDSFQKKIKKTGTFAKAHGERRLKPVLQTLAEARRKRRLKPVLHTPPPTAKIAKRCQCNFTEVQFSEFAANT